MNSPIRIKNDARACRAQLTKSFQEVRHRLSLPQLAEDALIGLDARLGVLGRVKSGILRNPLFAAVVLAGAGWLVRDVSRSGGKNDPDGLSRSRRPAKPVNNTTNHKGDPR